MLKKILFLGLVIGALAFPQNSECQGMSVITVSRHQNLAMPGRMEIYIDGNLYQTPGRKPQPITLRRGETATIPVYHGTHTIAIRIGVLKTEPMQFTVSGEGSIAFIAAYVNDKLVLDIQD